MVKPQEKNTFKYGMPLYGAAWPEGDVFFLAGGGGSGIQNRLVFARYKRDEQELLDQIGQFNFGDKCAFKTVLHPRGRLLLVGLSNGELRCFVLDTTRPRVPKVTEVTGELAARLKTIGSEDMKVLSFSAAGDLLALGYESGNVQVLNWPALTATQFQLSGETAMQGGIRDLDFSQGGPKAMLAICGMSGKCELWQLSPPACLARLQAPASLGVRTLNSCRFARDGSGTLFTTAMGRAGTHYIVWEDQASGGKGQWEPRRSVLVSKDSVVAAEASPDGEMLAVATSEAEVIVLSTATLKCVKQKAKAHMVFPTGLTFSSDSQQLLSISMDASAHVLDLRGAVPAQAPSNTGRLIACAIALLAALAAFAHMLVSNPALRPLLDEALQLAPWWPAALRPPPLTNTDTAFREAPPPQPSSWS